jgi:hypothetical protein
MRSGFTARSSQAALLILGAVLLGGCPWDKPKIQDLWTRVDLPAASLVPGQALQAGTSQTITVSTDIYYRSILTGFAVAELRSCSGATAATVAIDPDAERSMMAQAIDGVLAHSVTAGRATRAVTGWDHLIQHIDFTFTGVVPAALDSTGAPSGLFLICYLGSGTKLRLADDRDSIVVTPFNSTRYEVLPIGMKLGVTP